MQTSLVVIGSLNADIVATGLKRFPQAGEHVYGKELIIGPGGKSRNIADMAAHLMDAGKVAMLGRTTRDKYGLWRVPIDALQQSGVNTDFVVVDERSDKLPGIALLAVDQQGNNQIIVLPGASDDFCNEDVDKAKALFEAIAQNNGYLAVTLECPFATVRYAVEKAKAMKIKIVFDPGGIDSTMPVESLLDGLFLIKPNEHEAKMLTGIEVRDFDSAKQAAQKLLPMGVENVLITVGSNGAYLFTGDTQKHLPAPNIPDSGTRDETGCGDQTIATLCAYLQAGKSIEDAAEVAILSGTLQFQKQGIQPVTKEELEGARQ
jgi:ribokinase